MNKAELLKGYTCNSFKGEFDCVKSEIPCDTCIFDSALCASDNFIYDVAPLQYYQLIKLIEEFPSEEITLDEFLELKKQLK